ncbi:MAG TPA: hypothetical protein VKR42_13230 [Ktedonobacteraceae bacterium]|nr:hypothetical protein [Ktedonobacteraceae bacterium]
MATLREKKAFLQTEDDVDDNDIMYQEKRNRSNVRRYDRPNPRDTMDDPHLQKAPLRPRRSSLITQPDNVEVSKAVTSPAKMASKVKRNRYLLFALIGGMLVMSILILSFSAIGSWWHNYQDDLTYGRPRTFQMDAVVGHNDSLSNPSHFIFINLNRHVEIIEFPGGDASKARVYSGPVLFGDGQDLIPITGEFRDVNGDGKPDMIVHIQDQQLIFINTGTEFRPLQPGETVHP